MDSDSTFPDGLDELYRSIPYDASVQDAAAGCSCRASVDVGQSPSMLDAATAQSPFLACDPGHELGKNLIAAEVAATDF